MAAVRDNRRCRRIRASVSGVIRLKFHSDTSFNNFIGDASDALGGLPGRVVEAERSVLLTREEYEADAVDLKELVRDYGGQIVHDGGLTKP